MNSSSSIQSGVFQQSFDKREWHYHDSYELIMISEGTGQRIVGDTMEEFKPGDLVFLGRRLPHLWISDPIKIDPGSDKCVESIFVQFEESFLDMKMIALSEFELVRKAIERSARGIVILGKSRDRISELMMQVPYLNGFEQILNTLSILNEIGKTDEFIYLTSEKYPMAVKLHGSERIRVIRNYFMQNYQQQIDLNNIAQLVNMQPASLCRFFKGETGQTLTEYINRMRIDLASKMLMNKTLKIEEIAFECGFNTISYFNRQFKKITGTTPLLYQKNNFP